MFEVYTEKARRTIFFARYEASQFGSPYIETEHLLLGLMREANPTIGRHLGPASYEEPILNRIKADAVTQKKNAASADLPLSNECKRVLAYAAEESFRLGDKHVGPEHLLLGLLRETGCFAEKLLAQRGASLERLRRELSELERQNSSLREPPLPAHFFGLFEQKLTSAVIFAMYEASRFGSSAVDTEHLLLGLVHEAKPALDRLLDSDISEETVRKEIAANAVPQNPGSMNLANIPLTDQGKRALTDAAIEGAKLGHKSVKPEHLILGLLHDSETFGARMLLRRGAEPGKIRKKLSGDLPAVYEP